jgi:hypothetical protein
MAITDWEWRGIQQDMQLNGFRTLLILTALLILALEIHPQAFQRDQAPQSQQDPEAESILEKNTLFTVYGRTFGVAPVLGRLGQYASFKDMEKDIKPWMENIQSRNGDKDVIAGVHLIYAMAIPCVPDDDCLLYLEGRVKDVVGTYIKPAAERGWMVVLDTQIGKSNPVSQVQRIIDKGYLKYENVAIAIDPEFKVHPGRECPGTPIGTVKAWQINQVQRLLDDYVRKNRQSKKKILIVHQFGDANVNDGVPFMIENKKSLKNFDNVELVIDVDGLGKQAIKVVKYNKITDSEVYPFIKFRGIKVFLKNRWEKHGHFDDPPMNLDQIFGHQPVKGGPRMRHQPDVLIIA